jgi:hypothetical protein
VSPTKAEKIGHPKPVKMRRSPSAEKGKRTPSLIAYIKEMLSDWELFHFSEKGIINYAFLRSGSSG